jgi:adenylate cyclase class 2
MAGVGVMNEQATVERELKFATDDLAGLRERLPELEAERLGESGLEENRILDRSNELEERGCILRLRTDRQGAWLTYKGPARFDGEVKVREEHQTRVEDPEALVRVLGSLGYEVVRRYQKKREEWRLGGVTVALDHTPIGDFAEFEGEGAETVARRCGFETGSAERRNYLQLYDDHLREHPESPPDMVFPV